MSVLPEIDSRFDVLEKLGEGGMGCVYKVRHRDLDEVQIVKTLQAHLSGNEALRTRFINEARRGMRLRHPHIAGVHDFAVCADGTGYIVMEYVQGHNLRDILHARGPMPVSMVGEIAIQALDALAYLHEEKFVHRDISPDNLMLTRTGDGRMFIKLIDLGISKSLEEGPKMTGTGQFLGKVSFASPEQFGGDLDGRSDLYSLGVVLYNLLTGAMPFAGTDNRELIAALLFKAPRPFVEVAPETRVPEAVQQVVLRALEKDPDKRFRDAHEFRAAVEEAFDIDVRTLSATTRPARTLDNARAYTEPDPTQIPLTIDVPPPPPPTDKTEVSSFPGEPTLVKPQTRGTRLSTSLMVTAAVAVCLLAVAFFVFWQRRQAAYLASFGKFHAVVIGESDYQKYESLPTAVADARAVADVLGRDYGFEVTRLENAGKEQILDAIRATKKRMTAGDNLLVYYAGHGAVLNDKGYWQPVDADLEMTNWISPALIKDVLLDHPARRTLVIADSCHSGALARGALSTEAEGMKEKRARIMISSGGNAPVIDSADGRHSIFTGALLEVLGEKPGGAVDVQKLFPRIRERVVDSAKRAGREQIPQVAVMSEVGDEGGTFYFVRR